MAKSAITLGQAVPCMDEHPPQYKHLVAKSDTTLDQANLWSDIPLVKASSGQE